MYRLIVAVLAVITVTVLSAFPTFAGSDEQRAAWSLNDILNHSSRIFTETITHGLASIQDRIEMNATTTPGENGEDSTHLVLKLFPNGKGQPDDAIGLQGTVRRYPGSSDTHFGLDFRIVPPTRKADPKEYM